MKFEVCNINSATFLKDCLKFTKLFIFLLNERNIKLFIYVRIIKNSIKRLMLVEKLKNSKGIALNQENKSVSLYLGLDKN